MRILITAGVDPSKPYTPSDTPPSDELIAAYMKYNEDLHKAGVLVAAEGLSPAAGGRARLVVKGGKRTVTDGPFAETKELLGGFYLLEVDTMAEAVEWAQRCPVGLGFDEVLDIYQLTDLADIPPFMIDIVKRAAPEWFASVSQPRSLPK